MTEKIEEMFFNGYVIQLVGCSTAQRNIMKENALRYGAIMINPRSLLFLRTPLDASVTHIIVESTKLNTTETGTFLTEDMLRGLLMVAPNVELPPTGVNIVSTNWLHACIAKKTKVSEVDFLVKIHKPSDHVSLKTFSVASEECNPSLPPGKRARSDISFQEQIDSVSASEISLEAHGSLSSRSPDDMPKVGLWCETADLLYFLDSRMPLGSASRNVLAFDMDGTLITTRSGKTHAAHKEDWKYWHEVVPSKVAQAHNVGTYICIISNQAGLGNGKCAMTRDDFKLYVNSIRTKLQVPCDFICCTSESEVYRKPNLGMWEFLRKYRCSKADLSECMYVGDAAGRPKCGTRRKDFSASDYKFAINAGIAFLTPECYFLDSIQSLHRILPSPS